MASIIEVKNGFRAQVRRVGQPVLTKTFTAKTFGTLNAAKKEAQAWAVAQESAIDSGKKVGAQGKTGILISKLVDDYLASLDHIAPSGKAALNQIKEFMKGLLLEDLTDDWIVNYIESREFTPASGAFHFSYLRSMLKMAKIGWKFHVPDVLKDARDRLNFLGLIGSSTERTRRPTQEEIDKLLAYDWKSKIPMPKIIMFAINSTMRRAEITRIKWETFNEEHKTVVITDRKHPKKKKGNHQTVPLLDSAMAIIQDQPRDDIDGCIFPYHPDNIGRLFGDACVALGIEDLHFHDLRHEAISRLFEMGYQIHEVSMFSGHLDWKQLKRYTQLKAKDLRRLQTKQEPKQEVKQEQVAMPNMTPELAAKFEMFLKMEKMMEMMGSAKAA